MLDEATGTIRVATLTKVAVLELSVAQAREPGPGEACVAVDACGICGSDLHMFHGHHPILRPPLILGHEFVGRVVAVAPDVRDLRVGDRVVVVAGRGCGTCAVCLDGQFNRCEELKVIGGHLPGGLEDRVTLPADQFVQIPEKFSIESAALIEVAAVALHTVERCGSVAGRACLVLGCGPVGLVLTRVLRALDAGFIAATDVSLARRALAEASGADLVVDGLYPDEALLEAQPQRFDIAYECVGRQETLHQALRLTRRGAAIGLTAIFPGGSHHSNGSVTARRTIIDWRPDVSPKGFRCGDQLDAGGETQP